MSKGCLNFLNIICFWKKQRKQPKPVKAEDVVELVAPEFDEDVEPVAPEFDEERIISTGPFRPCSMQVDSDEGKLWVADSSSPLKDDFNKVKTFDIRGVTKTKENSIKQNCIQL
ncbi:hypothetical protein AALP_AA3G303700 [Arabis alpina]|uniref:Uncharacterized protein n=1 Tax=Arabis alpina TaxID=50452 RepID=A0A087HCQ0_ARAAL|nr:hypothetical protein AALP_AA3G303700 [Arabis alpina]